MDFIKFISQSKSHFAKSFLKLDKKVINKFLNSLKIRKGKLVFYNYDIYKQLDNKAQKEFKILFGLN